MFCSVFEDDDSLSEMPVSWLTDRDPTINNEKRFTSLQYVVNHVFFNPNHPKYHDDPGINDTVLVRAACVAAHAYHEYIDHSDKLQWLRITTMLDNFKTTVEPWSWHLSDEVVISQLRAMKPGDILTFPIRSQAAGIIFRKEVHCTIYEPMNIIRRFPHVEGKLEYSHPELAVEIPNDVFDNSDFQFSLAIFLSHMSQANREGQCHIHKGWHTSEFEGIWYTNFETSYDRVDHWDYSGHLLYTTSLLTGILKSVGKPAEPQATCVTKHLGHEVGRQDDEYEVTPAWSRSLLWPLIKVAIQSSLDRSPSGRATYKYFMLFFMFSLANHGVSAGLSSDLLHLMSTKILRRLRKLGSTSPGWLSDAVRQTCNRISETMDNRWIDMQAVQCLSPLFTPSQLDITRDTHLVIPRIHEHTLPSPMIHDGEPHRITLPLGQYMQRTLSDFLSSQGKLFRQAYRHDPRIALRSVERAVEQGIDDWVVCVQNPDEACSQLEILADRYLSGANDTYALREGDRGDPEYHPEGLSTAVLTIVELWVAIDKLVTNEIPFLVDYSPEISPSLLDRVLLLTPMSFHRVCRLYKYISSRHSRACQGWSVASRDSTPHSFCVRYFDSHLQHIAHIGNDVLPSDRLQAQAGVFKSHHPTHLRLWGRVIGFLLGSLHRLSLPPNGSDSIPWNSGSHSEIGDTLYGQWHDNKWLLSSDRFVFELPSGVYAASRLQQSITNTIHTPNQVLSAQDNCCAGLSQAEFIAFAHLRSGGSLQWINILRELRGRTLNFRHPEVYLLLAQACSQVGTLSVTGYPHWHQELQDTEFCYALLDELEGLLDDLGAGLSDGPAMATITLLARSVSAHQESGLVDRVIRLLREVRRKTFDWVEKQLYDMIISPTDEQGRQLLADMAAICRSTFDVGPSTVHKLLYSAEDVEVALSCAFLIRTTFPVNLSEIPTYSRLLLAQDQNLSLALESALKDAILADPSDLGIDLAIRKFWPSYQPSSGRWVPYHNDPSSHWLVCETEEARDRRAQIVHVNLLNGVLLLDGIPIGDRLPTAIVNHPEYRRIFGEINFVINPSSLLGMDFVTRFMVSNHYVHFSLRDNDLAIRTQDRGNKFVDLIPHGKLEGDLPPMLIEGHAHWWHQSTSIIEIRPLGRVLEQSPENWEIVPVAENCYRVTKCHESLVDIRSATWEMASRPLERLEIPENLIVTASSAHAADTLPRLRVSVTLPRYGLSFFINENHELESYDFKDMVCDENQCIGTLVGLVNRLILRSKAESEKDLIPRCILIPDGEVRLEKDVCQVRVIIDTVGRMAVDPSSFGSTRRLTYQSFPRQPVTYYTYTVDPELGRLTGITGLSSELYLARLHALTGSACRPDPLTGRTGLEEAISLVHSMNIRLHLVDSKSANNEHVWPLQKLRSPQLRFASDFPEPPPHFQVFSLDDSKPSSGSYAMRREAYLFPSEIVERLPRNDDKGFHHSRTPFRDSQRENTNTEEFGYAIAATVYQWSFNAPGISYVSSWAEVWRDVVTRITRLMKQFRSPDWCSNEGMKEYVEEHLAAVDRGPQSQRLQLLFFLPSLLSAIKEPGADAILLSVLMAVAKQLNIHHPVGIQSALSDGYYPDPEILRDFLKDAWRSTDRVSDLDVNTVFHSLLCSWPSAKVPTMENSESYDMEHLTLCLGPLHSRLYHNYLELKDYFISVVCGDGLHSFPAPSISPHWCTPELVSPDWQTLLCRLLSERAAPQLPAGRKLSSHYLPRHSVPSSDSMLSNQLLSCLRLNDIGVSFQNQYICHLLESDHYFHMEPEGPASAISREVEKPALKILEAHYAECRVIYREALDVIRDTLAPRTDFEQALCRSGQWPRVTPWTIFRCLAFTSPIKLSDRWKICLITLAHLALEVQRARRLVQFSLNKLEEELFMELSNRVDENVAIECLDWLLMELQGNFLIRRVQMDAAREMVSPRSGGNTVIQVNMGEGKSSVIIPMCVTALADGDRLVRIILPKALKAQILHILLDRLGGLVCRRIHHLTFTRTGEKYDQTDPGHLHQLMSECRDECGVIVMQPEHALSLSLACVEPQLLKDEIGKDRTPVVQNKLDGMIASASMFSLFKSPVGGSYVSDLFRQVGQWSGSQESQKSVHLLENKTEGFEIDENAQHGKLQVALQNFIQNHMRDILDESDEILQPRLQVIYTIGSQQHVDGLPDRWVIAQQVLRLVKDHASSLDPHRVEFEPGFAGSFPHIHVLHADGGTQLISSIVEDVVHGRAWGLSFPLSLREPIRAFISQKDLPPGTAKLVENYAQKGPSWNTLLTLRGLLANNILLFALMERRWRVDYGLNPTRTLVAVPYRAKDVPAETAEFGHPDITIVLTCLSYYYGGLTEKQLMQSFEILLEQDDPSNEYTLWVSDCTSKRLPSSLQNLGSFDIHSQGQWNRHIFPTFRRNQRAIDFYLSRVVFPEHAKEFPWKISGSSWDIAEKKGHLVTGFSGTSDARYLLPISISQQDSEHLRQKGTDARVLTYLLQPENASYSVTANGHGERLTTLELLETIMLEKHQIHVLLDIGAQILDLSNHQVAQAWLEMSRGTAGAIYFDDDDELMVLTRNGKSQPLSSSPLSQQLDRCTAYLDHAHTRGTDIKFPRGFRAAAILGLKVTKDRLVQGCMRMRRLGHGHSVKFFAPPEVDHAIRLLARKDATAGITTGDILHWTIRETWRDIQGRAPYWAQQGMRHKSQQEAWARFCHDELTSEQLTDSWLQPEHKSLAELYAPGHSTDTTFPMVLDKELRKRCEFLGVSSLPNARLEEEQEREVYREVEREREVERPPAASPARHSLHPDVTAFVRNGVILSTSPAFRPIFTTLDRSSAATNDAHVWSPYILATADFCRSATNKRKLSPGRVQWYDEYYWNLESNQDSVEEYSNYSERSTDDYLRPVQWILSGKMYGNDVLVILSPFEADRLMPDIRVSEHVHLHPYTPRTSKFMKPCDDLKLYPIPPVPSTWTPPWALIDQLNVFAGQLYLRDFEAYARLSRFLGVHREDLPSDATTLTKPRWVNMPGSLDQGIEETFEDNPLQFVMLLLAIRRRGMRFDDTHMGRLVQGWLLTRDDFPKFDSGSIAESL